MEITPKDLNYYWARREDGELALAQYYSDKDSWCVLGSTVIYLPKEITILAHCPIPKKLQTKKKTN